MKRILTALLLALVLLAASAVPALADNNVETTAVAQMDIKYNCGCTRVGEGTMVATNGMLTCAHNLVCTKHNKKIKSCVFYFGRNNKKYTYKYNGKFSYTYYGNYSGDYSSIDDIGYIVFPKDIGKNTGWFASSVESDDDLKWEFCHMTAYNGNKRVTDWNQVNIYNAKQITWSATDEFKKCGEGGPVYYGSSDLEFPVLVAVYTSHSTDYGVARRFTKQVFDDMKADGVKFTKK